MILYRILVCDFGVRKIDIVYLQIKCINLTEKKIGGRDDYFIETSICIFCNMWLYFYNMRLTIIYEIVINRKLYLAPR